jgi:hypothetical protein
MGFEYEGRLRSPLPPGAIRQLLDSLAADGRWRVCRRGEHDLALAYAGRAMSPDWPESIVIEASEARIYLLFHSGDGAEVREFLDAVTRTLESLGTSCDLNEL